ncbi:MAG: type II toxin-antitoxin system VapC family toxin [Spirochaetia bacterium]|jgi:tRNA(fMet)-specific endonuclease VapC|nr:type II toxin-antitoxin system VapC family toxin [Spirochaetia bacterium]
MYVLDTNILIYFFKGMGSVSDKLLSCTPKEIYIPAIVLYELEVGIGKSQSPDKRIKQLEDLTSVITILPFTKEAAKYSANIRVLLEKKGKLIRPFDTLIAGTALAHKAVLVTHNTKEFERVPNLQIEDWL